MGSLGGPGPHSSDLVGQTDPVGSADMVGQILRIGWLQYLFCCWHPRCHSEHGVGKGSRMEPGTRRWPGLEGGLCCGHATLAAVLLKVRLFFSFLLCELSLCPHS